MHYDKTNKDLGKNFTSPSHHLSSDLIVTDFRLKIDGLKKEQKKMTDTIEDNRNYIKAFEVDLSACHREIGVVFFSTNGIKFVSDIQKSEGANSEPIQQICSK